MKGRPARRRAPAGGSTAPLGRIATGPTAGATHVRCADFDGDGKTDSILIGAGGEISAWLNRGGDGRVASGPVIG
ncbi:hypothetical protein [Streptomyces sp. NPDC008317]|uniref:hypothetical protein n=1 Tax=Streptomyces sp. NPDC008317 TaxID=3364827 RepID=UPI0036E599FC